MKVTVNGRSAMPKLPKSPLEKLESGYKQRPSEPRRTSSSEKASKHSSSDKHEVKSAVVGYASARNIQSTMSVSSSPAATGLSEVGDVDAEVGKRPRTEVAVESANATRISVRQPSKESMAGETKT